MTAQTPPVSRGGGGGDFLNAGITNGYPRTFPQVLRTLWTLVYFENMSPRYILPGCVAVEHSYETQSPFVLPSHM